MVTRRKAKGIDQKKTRGLEQGRPPTASPKSMPISGTKNERSGHSKVLLQEQQTDQQMWKHFPVHCQILKRANMQLFQRRKQNRISYSHSKVARLHKNVFTLQKLGTLIFVSGGKGGMPGLSRALEPAQGSKVASRRLFLLPVTEKGLFF